MQRPTVADMERVLGERWPDVDEWPLLRSLRSPRTVLWYRRGKIYVPPDVYERWRDDL